MTDSEVDDEYDHLTLETKIRRMFSFDKKDKLVSTIKGQLVSNGKLYFYGHSPPDLLILACRYQSVKCATALLQGEAGISLDVNVADKHGSFPLHCAADRWSLPIIKLYLQHGAEINVRCAPHHSCFGGMLPFNAALPTFRIHHFLSGWTPKQSIFMLIIRLCLPEMRRGLDTVKFLAWNTKGAQEEIYHYAKKGNIIELAVLLMAAREKFNALFPFPSHDGSKLYQGLTLRQVIAAEITQLVDEDVRTIARGESNSLTGIFKDEKKLMKAVLLLLEVFERAGDAIDAYLQLERTNVSVPQVANEVASLLMEAGFVLKHQDIDLSDIHWFPSKDKLKYIVWKFQPKYLDVPLSTQPCSILPYRNNEDKSQNRTTLAHGVSNPKAEFMTYMPTEQQRLASLQFPRSSSTLCSNMQSFHTLHSGKDGLSFELPLTSETQGLDPDEVSLNMEEEIKDLIVADNKHEFVSIIKSQLGKQNSDSKVFPSELLMWVCCHRAVNCATAILDGETDLRLDLNSAFKCGSFPLHHAAHSLSSGLIELFLQHGADANLRCDDTASKFSGLLPLEVALKTLSCHQFLTDWSPKKSIYKLLFILCRLEMKEPLDAIRVLALKTKEVEETISLHAKKGDLIEMAALLMVAQEKVMAWNNDGSSLDGSMRIRQCIIHETTLLDKEFRSIDGSQCSKLVRTYKTKRALMSSVLLLLEVFERAGLAIEEYIQHHSMNAPPEWIPKEVAWMLEHFRFELKEKDIVMNDIECFSPKLGPPQSEELKECRSLIKKFHMPLNSQRGGVSFAKSVNGMRDQQQRSICFSLGYPVSSPVSRSYHTFQIPKPICGSKSVATIEAEMKKTTKSSQHCVSHLPSSTKWASVAIAIMRRWKRV